jgi:hypothetical protein
MIRGIVCTHSLNNLMTTPRSLSVPALKLSLKLQFFRAAKSQQKSNYMGRGAQVPQPKNWLPTKQNTK